MSIQRLTIVLVVLFVFALIVPTAVAQQPALTGTIHLSVHARPADGTIFSFCGDLGEFILGGPPAVNRTRLEAQTITWTELEVGTYNVTEIVPKGWTLMSVRCSTTDPNDATVYAAGILSIDLDYRETVSCVFINVQGPQPREPVRPMDEQFDAPPMPTETVAPVGPPVTDPTEF